jgi:RES domain
LSDPAELEHVWRVGYHAEPLGFTPYSRCDWSHRFDDADRNFRSVYSATTQETALREVLADLRPKAKSIGLFLEIFGEDAEEELEPEQVTAAWRREHVLTPARVVHSGVLDLSDPAVRADLERRHAKLLGAHGMDHLDLHELTTRQREVTQAIATDVYGRLDVGVIRFISSRDGGVCFAALEGLAELERVGDDIPLNDPPPPALMTVARDWGLELEPAPPA